MIRTYRRSTFEHYCGKITHVIAKTVKVCNDGRKIHYTYAVTEKCNKVRIIENS